MQTILPKSTKHSVDFRLIIENLLGLLLFLLPFFFVPLTADAVGFNKVYLVSFVSSVVLVLFFVNGLKNKRIDVLDPKMYLSLLALVVVAGLSVVFSRNRSISVFGYYGNYSTSYIFLLSLFLISFVVSNLNISAKKLLNYFLVGTTVSTVISFLPFFGLPIPFLGDVVREFTLAGSPNTLIGLQVLAVITSFYLLSAKTTKNKKWKVFYGVVIALNLSYLIGTLYALAIGLVAVFVTYMAVTKRLDIKKNLDVLVPVLGIVLVLSVVSILPQSRNLLGISEYSDSVRLPLEESWRVSANLLVDFPLVGTGPGTYFMGYSYFRPTSLNYTDAWRLRFATPNNDLFLWLSTAGILGFIVYLLFWAKVVKDNMALKDESDSNFLLKLVSMTVLFTLLLLGYNYILYVVLFMFYGVVLHRIAKETESIKVVHKYALASLLTLSIVLFAGFMFVAYTKYAGQYLFRKSVMTTNLVERYNTQKRALQFDSRESLYRRENILTGLIIARQLAQQENLQEGDVEIFGRVVQEAVLDARRLTELINPLDVANWEIRGLTYNSLVGLNQNAYPFAVQAYTNALNLEQTNPSLWLTRGQVYYAQQDYLRAAQDFARAVQLKNDYANAYFNLAYALKELRDYTNAVTQLEIVNRLLPQDSPDRENLAKDLEEFRRLAQEQQDEQRAQLELLQQQQAENQGINQQGSPAANEPLSRPDQQQEQVQVEPREDLNVEDEVLQEETVDQNLNEGQTDITE